MLSSLFTVCFWVVVASPCVPHTILFLQTQPLQVHPMAAPTTWGCVSSSACLGHWVCLAVHVPQVLNLMLTTGRALPTSLSLSSPLCLLLKALVWKEQTTLRQWSLWLGEVSGSYKLPATVFLHRIHLFKKTSKMIKCS